MKLGILDYVADGEGCPPDLAKALLCETYHCLPSALRQEDLAELLRLSESMTLYHALVRQAQGAELSQAEDRLVGEVLGMDLGRERWQDG